MIYLKYFIIFVSIRLILWHIYGTNLDTRYMIDAYEYMINGTALDVIYKAPEWTYNFWYERTPLYMLFMHVIQGNLFFQILVCGIAGTLAFKLNSNFGLFYLIYPNFIFQSFNYSKEALLISLILVLIYFLHDKQTWLLIAVMILNLGFLGYSESLINFNLSKSINFMDAVWQIWKPGTDLYFGLTVGNMIATVLYFPFYLTIPYYLKKIDRLDISIFIIIGITVFFSFGWANVRYREIAMPFIIYYLCKHEKIIS